MKNSKNLVMLSTEVARYITGGARCVCQRNLTPMERANPRHITAQQAEQLMTLWSKEFGTKSQCRNECCEITGGWKFIYGSVHEGC